MHNPINFTKMQALGNDFVLLNTKNSLWVPDASTILALSDRHRGIGFDQLLLIRPSNQSHFDYYYRIFNADGSEVTQCGNGARCVAQYLHQHVSPQQKRFILQTHTTPLELKILNHPMVSLRLPCPSFHPQDLPFLASQQNKYQIQIEQEIIEFHAISVGNPHIVIVINDEEKLLTMDIQKLGQVLENHPLFPKRCNVNFAHFKSQEHIMLRVWERGAGETLACGSGALATACVAREFYQLAPQINVILKGGVLNIHWPHRLAPVEQIGPAVEVFSGTMNLANFKKT